MDAAAAAVAAAEGSTIALREHCSGELKKKKKWDNLYTLKETVISGEATLSKLFWSPSEKRICSQLPVGANPFLIEKSLSKGA